MSFEILRGDCRFMLQLFVEDNSVDAIVTDPPYELGFMGKGWDSTGVANDVRTWREALRVLKPGGHLLAFSGTRTYHRMVCAIEDAGFEVRDQMAWVYGSGFPKSHNGEWGGTALKPAWEPIVMARKPLIGTVEANWRTHGTGALNIEGCRVGDDGGTSKAGMSAGAPTVNAFGDGLNTARFGVAVEGLGRWPANIIHDGSDEVIAAFPDAAGQQGDLNGQSKGRKSKGIFGDMPAARQAVARVEDSKSAARFFYCAKASKRDRGDGNVHPTVKPTELMRYLCRLVTPPGGVVLDPFLGSGSTGKAAMLEGFKFIGVELSDEYADIATARIGAIAFGDIA